MADEAERAMGGGAAWGADATDGAVEAAGTPMHGSADGAVETRGGAMTVELPPCAASFRSSSA